MFFGFRSRIFFRFYVKRSRRFRLRVSFGFSSFFFVLFLFCVCWLFGCGVCLCCVIACRVAVRARVSVVVLAWWQAWDRGCRLSVEWLSPGVMWSMSVAWRLHPAACHLPVGVVVPRAFWVGVPIGWGSPAHLLLFLCRTCCLILFQLFGSRCLRVLVVHAMCPS